MQSVLCDAASNPNSGLEENSKGSYRVRPNSIRLINREVLVDGLGRTLRSEVALKVTPNVEAEP